jgi:ribosomal protein L32
MSNQKRTHDNKKIPQGKPEDTTGVTRRYHMSNQKIPQGNKKIPHE